VNECHWKVECQRFSHTVPEVIAYIRERVGTRATGKPQENEDSTYMRDIHNTKEYDCDIHNKRIKDRWKREVSPNSESGKICELEDN
jgi:hypothetical protein